MIRISDKFVQDSSLGEIAKLMDHIYYWSKKSFITTTFELLAFFLSHLQIVPGKIFVHIFLL